MNWVSSNQFFVARHHINRGADQPKVEDSVDENGIRTIIEHTVNDEGKKVKVSRPAEIRLDQLLTRICRSEGHALELAPK
jgi:hypothetical protein